MNKKTALCNSDTHVILLVEFLLWTGRVNGGWWQCSEERLVYTSDFLHSTTVLAGSYLSYNLSDPILIQHSCGRYFSGGIPPALYLGEKVFISLDRFESSLLPLTILHNLVTPPALVSDATFVQNSRVLIVINGKVYIYFYKWKTWLISDGINKPITKITNMDCCYSTSDPVCNQVSNYVLAYDSGNIAEESNIFYSDDGGYSFAKFYITPFPKGILIAAYNFVSIAQTGMLFNQTENNGNGSAYFIYSGTSYMNNRKGVIFSLRAYKNESVLSIMPPGLRGFIMLWTKHDLVFSFNNGLTLEPISVLPTEKYVNESLPKYEEGICNVAVTSSEVAALTKNQKLFYGTLDIVSTKMVLIGERNSSESATHCDVLMFDTTGMLTIFNPVPSNETGFYNFHKCTINLQDRLMNVRPHLQPCPVEILSGDFHNKMYYIDMKKELHFNITFVPKPGTGAFPYVTVSNPHVLGFQAKLLQDGYTYDGNIKYCLQVTALQQQFTSIAERSFQDDLFHTRISTLTVDIYNKGIFCIDMHPLTALIAMDCPPTKHIRPFKNITVCNKGFLHEARLRNNFYYTIHRDIYDPAFLGRQHLDQDDLNISYPYKRLGCPILWYYDSPWLPVLELWEDDKFVEYVSADFVLFEINGMHNYDYLLTASEAKCISQPQNWTRTFQMQPYPDPHTSWNRISYRNCKVPNEEGPLVASSLKYQVLNLNEENRIIFSQYNGIYVFKVIVVDTVYSYCELSTVFSVYVLGAHPKSQINPIGMLIGVLILILGSILMGYFFPKLLHLRENAAIKTF
ncbi:cation channel sperm-associated auxiliary subunit delta-like [Eublepharis macularius]|uniref:Cation channel sperm-associated auxiliary subunit delta n=1 Tax=Eublepharis macularius TaxID=481883 RepID=A0AA97L4C8_EUBMA|nr:cation channel sperm-associated auxiliary subunit delta-like [Eublepharis macularius]